MSELPERVQAKIITLADAEAQARTAVTMTQNAIREAQYAHDINPEGDRAAALAREVRRLEDLQPTNQARHRALADLNAKVSHYLATLPANAELSDARPVKAKLGQGESHLTVVTRMRGEIMALISERGRVERSSPTIREMKASAAQFVQSLVPQARLVTDHDKFKLEFGRGVIGEADPTPLQVLAWVDPTLVISRLEAMIDAQPKPENQMSSVDRKKRLNEIRDELLELECIEQAHIDAARLEGSVTEQRGNVDIKALLGLVVSKVKSQAA